MEETPPEIAEMLRTVFMALSGAERFKIGCVWFHAARHMILASLPPGLSETERKRMLYRRIYGEELPPEIV